MRHHATGAFWLGGVFCRGRFDPNSPRDGNRPPTALFNYVMKIPTSVTRNRFRSEHIAPTKPRAPTAANNPSFNLSPYVTATTNLITPLITPVTS